ncbi:MAG: 3',5'-cyclic-AMP phosphodiesterase [Aeromonas sp.]
MLATPLPTARDGSVHLLQVTDPHLFADPAQQLLGVATTASLQAVVQAIAHNAQSFDAILATGDLSQDHSAASYQRFAECLAPLAKPIFWLPGNHDAAPVMNSVLRAAGISEAKQLIGDHWQVILLDTQVAAQPHGVISAEQLQALKGALEAYPDRHALIVLHHHVQPVGCQWLDQHDVHNHAELFALLANYPQATTVLSGHVHQEVDTCYQGMRLLASPSTCIQFKPHCAEFTLDSAGPGWRYLTLYPDGRVATDVWRLPLGQFVADAQATGY